MKNKPTLSQSQSLGFRSWQTALWLVVAGGALFFWPACSDRYLAPRFLYLAAALLVVFIWLRREWIAGNRVQMTFLDIWLLGWYGLNLLSVSWSISFSEGMFYAQKVLLMLGVYALVRQALAHDEAETRRTLRLIWTAVAWILILVVCGQLAAAWFAGGWDNERLYDFASGLSGNKSLASAFLFFLLVFQLSFAPTARPGTPLGWVSAGLMLGLILVLQVRTVYLAVAISLAVYVGLRAFFEPDFRRMARTKLLPAAFLGGLALVAFLIWGGKGNSMTERLNPLTYLDSQTANERLFVWYKTGLLNRDHPWLGVGNGSWKFWFPSKSLEGGYRMEEKNVVFTRAHNDYLEIQSEMGYVGLAAFVGIFAIALFTSLRSLRRLPDERRRVLQTALAGLIGYSVVQYFDFPRERIDFQVIMGVLLALAGHYAHTKSFTVRMPKWVWMTGWGAALSLCLIIGWNRTRGDIWMLKALQAQTARDWSKLSQAAVEAENRWFEYSDVALPLAWYDGVGWYQRRQIDQAIAAFEKAYRLNPWSFQVVNNYASALVQQNRFREAISLYEKALAINPRFDDGKFNLAYVHTQLGEYTQALQWLQRVDTIANPGNAEDREKNQRTLARQAEFRKSIGEKMK